MDLSVRIDLKVEPYMKNYLHRDLEIGRKFVDGIYQVSSTDIFGIVLLENLKLRPKDYYPKPRNIPEGFKMVIDLGVRTERWLRCYLPEEKEEVINRYLYKIIIRDAVNMCSMMVGVGAKQDWAIDRFYQATGLTCENIAADTIRKRLSRALRGRKTRTSIDL